MNNVNRLNETTVEIDGDTYELKKKAFTLRPSEGDDCEIIFIDGSIREDTWCDDSYHRDMWYQGSIAANKKSAILERDARIKERELTDFIAELNHREGWVCDWSDAQQYKLFFNSYHYGRKEFDSDGVFLHQYRPSSHYFKPELEKEIRAKFSHEDLRLIYCRERS